MRSTTVPVSRSLLRAVALAVLLVLVAAVPAGAAKTPPPPKDPGAVYLSLGDSLAFGFQEKILDHQFETGNFDPNAFRHGYADVLAQKLARLHRGIEKVNLGCPGETTESFRDACEYEFGLHEDYTGQSQLDAALGIINDRPGEVGTITVALGANDLLNFLDSCGDDTTCVKHGLPKAMSNIHKNLLFSVKALHKAAPDAVIVLLEYYNPFAPFDPDSSANLLPLNAQIAKVAKTTHSKVADAYASFNLLPRQPQRLCRLTLICNEDDIHASNAGYRVIANLMYDATGFAKTR
jgi:lysophospholipase L1-like esterase